jgi:DNA-binding NtrC family response regulator
MTAAVRVLLIEPHADTRELYARTFAAEGLEVVAVADGEAARRAFRHRAPSVVVSETWLPEGGEAELLNGFAESGAVVVALTTTPWQIPAGGKLAALLTKPCHPTDVVRMVRQAMAGHRLV